MKIFENNKPGKCIDTLVCTSPCSKCHNYLTVCDSCIVNKLLDSLTNTCNKDTTC